LRHAVPSTFGFKRLILTISPYQIFLSIVFFAMLVLLIGALLSLTIFQYQKRRQKDLLAMAQMKTDYEQELLRSQVEIQEQTLRIISQEIHDNIGQVLSLAKLQLHSLQRSQQQAQWQAALQPTVDLISKSIGDLRNLSKSLHPDRIAQIGLLASITHDLQLLQNTNTIHTAVEVIGTAVRLNPQSEVIIFRMFQEMMNNVMKHAQATNLRVLLHYEPLQLTITVADDGVGFAEHAPAGIGFSSLRTRALLLNAQLSVESRAGGGTTVLLSVPTT
jgi:two-component system, NarL family, sensor kinase